MTEDFKQAEKLREFLEEDSELPLLGIIDGAAVPELRFQEFWNNME